MIPSAASGGYPLKVLFIGNSYTYYYDLWDRFAEIAAAAGDCAETDSVTQGGYFLFQMNDPADPVGAIAAEKLERGQYDVVFLQDNSCGPLIENRRFTESVQNLTQKIRQTAQARVILYQTWGRREGNETLAENGWTHESMTQMLQKAYRTVAAANQIELSPVGDAFFKVHQEHPEIELYDPDGSHPSPAGSCLAALCHYAAAFQKSPVGIPYRYGVSSEAQSLILQQAAHWAVFRPDGNG